MNRTTEINELAEQNAVKTIKEGGKVIKKTKEITFIKFEDGKAVYELKSGDYKFSSHLN